MQRVAAARRERTIDVNQILHPADFRAQDNLVRPQSILFGQLRRIQGADDHGFHGYFPRLLRFRQQGVLIHHVGQQRLVERAPIHADAHRLLVLNRNLDHGAEIVESSLRPMPTLPGLMRYLAKARAQSGYFFSRMCPL